eukprot:CAMPEP_0170257302 /NCGR_PEP_ID=MMETSP0116_2-20130129/28508_1 /TAXON_ID=400756 /ORGANISM="Durinskia baltica, Strain CSIRO CS-38" /LENGTH=128 /DNA_ID=CAMNT_0010508319 /DNA_START=243 /DNA_END=626 /DNA_ORIENTATION=+
MSCVSAASLNDLLESRRQTGQSKPAWSSQLIHQPSMHSVWKECAHASFLQDCPVHFASKQMMHVLSPYLDRGRLAVGQGAPFEVAVDAERKAWKQNQRADPNHRGQCILHRTDGDQHQHHESGQAKKG